LTLDPVFHKILTPCADQGPKEKRRILPESPQAHGIHGHLWFTCVEVFYVWQTLL